MNISQLKLRSEKFDDDVDEDDNDDGDDDDDDDNNNNNNNNNSFEHPDFFLIFLGKLSHKD